MPYVARPKRSAKLRVDENGPYLEIALTQGLFTKVSVEDAWVGFYNWCAVGTSLKYARRRTGPSKQGNNNVMLHRLILGLAFGEIGDHINGDTLDNRRKNLRKATPQQNVTNSSVVRGASGVAYSAIHKRWLARISYGGKRKHLGWFKTREAGEAIYSDARIARNKELFGEKV